LTALRTSLLTIAFAATAGLLTLTGCRHQDAGPIDDHAVLEIRRLCADRNPCDVHLHDLMPGKWDTFYEFGPYQDQQDLDDVLGTNNTVHASRMQRILVFARDGKIIKFRYSDFGVERPMDGEVVFDEEFRSPVPFWVKYPPDQLLRVTPCETNKGVPLWHPTTGTYYLLTPLPLIPGNIPLCQRMF